MEELTSMTFLKSRLVERGDYLTLAWNAYRVVRVDSDTTITTRPVHRWTWLELLRARWESWVWWPVRDLLPIVRALASGKCWRLADGRTLWPLWGMAPRKVLPEGVTWARGTPPIK